MKSSTCKLIFVFEDFFLSSDANLVGTSLEFAAFGSGPDAKPSRPSAVFFFLSTTMAFAAVRTHFPRKNTCVYRNSHNLHNIESSRRTYRLNLQHLAMVWTSNIAELVPSSFLQQCEHIFPRKTTLLMSIELRSINRCLRVTLRYYCGSYFAIRCFPAFCGTRLVKCIRMNT